MQMESSLSSIQSRKRNIAESNSISELYSKDMEFMNTVIKHSSQENGIKISAKRLDFIINVALKIFIDICQRKSNLKQLVDLLIEATQDFCETCEWDISRTLSHPFNDPIEIIRPKSSTVSWYHAKLQPMNWACRRGHVDLLRYMIDAAPWGDIISPNLGDNKLYHGALTLAFLSGNRCMIDYLCKDIDMDPNHGPADWEPALVVFWETRNWEMLVSLIKGGASLHYEHAGSICPIDHLFKEGWGWDHETRLDAVLTLLFLGAPYHEDKAFSYPAYTIPRDYNKLRQEITNIQDIVCWNSNYEFMLQFLCRARNAAGLQNGTTLRGSQSCIKSEGVGINQDNSQSVSSEFPVTNNSGQNGVIDGLLSFNGHGGLNQEMDMVSSFETAPPINNEVNLDEGGDGDDEDDFSQSTGSIVTYLSHDIEHFMNIKRIWKNTAAIIFSKKGLNDEAIATIFNILLPRPSLSHIL